MVDRGAAPDAPQQPRRGGGRASRGARGLRRLGKGGALPRGAEGDRRDAASSRRRRDAARAERQAGRRLPHASGRTARADRQLAARAALGDLGGVPPARGARADDVRPDDRGLVDLHRDAGDPARDVPDLRGGRRDALRVGRPRRAHDPHRRARRDGRGAAARRHDGRRGDPLRRGRSRADRTAPADPLPRRGGRLARRRARARACGCGRGPRAVGRAARQRRRGRAGARASRGALRPRHRPDRCARSVDGLRAGRSRRARGGGVARVRSGRVPQARTCVDCATRARVARIRAKRQLRF